MEAHADREALGERLVFGLSRQHRRRRVVGRHAGSVASRIVVVRRLPWTASASVAFVKVSTSGASSVNTTS